MEANGNSFASKICSFCKTATVWNKKEQLAHCSELKVMTETPKSDVNKDYITLPAETYTNITARDAFQLKLRSFQSINAVSNSLSLFSPCTASEWISVILLPARLCGYFSWYAAMFYTLIKPNWFQFRETHKVPHMDPCPRCKIKFVTFTGVLWPQASPHSHSPHVCLLTGEVSNHWANTL